MKKVLLCILLLLIITGCSNKSMNNSKAADYLFNLKNSYIGDNSADIKLIEALELFKLGNYTIELETYERPYALTIKFDKMTMDISNLTTENYNDFKNKMRMYSVILLTLIDNADEIRYNDRYCDCIDNIVSLSVSDLQAEYGNIKEYGKSVGSLHSLLVDIGFYSGEFVSKADKELIDIAYSYLNDETKKEIINKYNAKIRYIELVNDVFIYAVKEGENITIRDKKVISIDFQKNVLYRPNNTIVVLDSDTKELLGFPLLD